MEICVEFDGTKWAFSPDPAVVDIGTSVTWKLQANALSPPQIRWTVYFDHGSPFRTQGTQFITTTLLTSNQHIGTTAAMSADDPGDYKYGVRAEDLSNQIILGDDDPRLVVV